MVIQLADIIFEVAVLEELIDIFGVRDLEETVVAALDMELIRLQHIENTDVRTHEADA
ncbi:hypothetical protein D3C71_2119340 [compost metagenome]